MSPIRSPVLTTTMPSPKTSPLPRPPLLPTPAPALSKSTPDYIAEIRRFSTHAQLLPLWKNILDGAPPAPWGAGKGLEHMVLRAFEIEGATIRWPFNIKKEGKGIVEQIDGAIYFDHFSVLVEAKDHESPISVEPIYKLRAQLTARPAGVLGAVFSRAGFTEPALLHAPSAPQTVLLWSPDDLTEALTRKRLIEGMKAKFRWAIEQAMPDRALRVEWYQ